MTVTDTIAVIDHNLPNLGRSHGFSVITDRVNVATGFDGNDCKE
jgi:hypothetical protein